MAVMTPLVGGCGGTSSSNFDVDIKNYGARCDGEHNDVAAFQAAIKELDAHGGGTLRIPGGCTCLLETNVPGVLFDVGDSTSLVGDGGVATVHFRSTVSSGEAVLFRLQGNVPTLRDLKIVNSSSGTTTLIEVCNASSPRLEGLELNGLEANGETSRHGLRLVGAADSSIQSLAIASCRFEGLSYGIFVDSSAALSLEGAKITDTKFRRNGADDIEFNGPSARLQDIEIRGCSFSENRYRDARAYAGFGVGMANCTRATVAKCSFEDYGYPAIHIEDSSADVILEDNHILNAAMLKNAGAAIVILSGSRQVSILRNTVEMNKSARGVPVILVTAGSTTAVSPSGVTIGENRFNLGSGTRDPVTDTTNAVTARSNTTVRS